MHLICFLTFIIASLFGPVFGYEVCFVGIDNPNTQELLKNASQTLLLKDSPPDTQAGLRRRAEGDIPAYAAVFQTLGYYSPSIDVSIDFDKTPILVTFKFDSGPAYKLIGYHIHVEDGDLPPDFCLSRIGITLETAALPKEILNAEDLLLEIYEAAGFPLAEVRHREVTGDQLAHTVTVDLYISTGPLCFFGDTVVLGNADIDESFIRSKIFWERDKIYDPIKVDKTVNALESTGLFTSISIRHGEYTSENDELPMIIEVSEGKVRSIGLGASYTTQWGPGVLAEWEHRNLFRNGERLSIKTNLWYRQQQFNVLYIKPDFYRRNQDLVLLAELQREQTLAFTDTSFSLSGLIQKRIHDHTRLSYGLTYKHIHDERSDNSRQYDLGKIPFQVRYSRVDNILDPNCGGQVSLKVTPTLQLFSPNFAYCITNLTGSAYQPLNPGESVILALKFNFGSIFGAPRHAIPPSERFYAGSDTQLRGYRYLTVSPLCHHHKPCGGRSLMIYSVETRLKGSEALSWVLFYDCGNVYEGFMPALNKKIRQSVGIGARYNTPVGPLRLDLAFPLNRRRHIDKAFQIYLSVGQAF